MAVRVISVQNENYLPPFSGAYNWISTDNLIVRYGVDPDDPSWDVDFGIECNQAGCGVTAVSYMETPYVEDGENRVIVAYSCSWGVNTSATPLTRSVRAYVNAGGQGGMEEQDFEVFEIRQEGNPDVPAQGITAPSRVDVPVTATEIYIPRVDYGDTTYETPGYFSQGWQGFDPGWVTGSKYYHILYLNEAPGTQTTKTIVLTGSYNGTKYYKTCSVRFSGSRLQEAISCSLNDTVAWSATHSTFWVDWLSLDAGDSFISPGAGFTSYSVYRQSLGNLYKADVYYPQNLTDTPVTLSVRASSTDSELHQQERYMRVYQGPYTGVPGISASGDVNIEGYERTGSFYVEYVNLPYASILSPSASSNIEGLARDLVSSSDTSLLFKYDIYVPQNTGYGQNIYDIRWRAQDPESLEIYYSDVRYIIQNSGSTPPEPTISCSNDVEVTSQDTQAIFQVEYIDFLVGNINDPYYSGGVTSVVQTGVVAGKHIYQVNFPTNTSIYPVTRSVTWNAQTEDLDLITKTSYIYQDGYHAPGSPYITVSPRSASGDWDRIQFETKVTYHNISADSASLINAATLNNPDWEIFQTTTATVPDGLKLTYVLRGPKNTGTTDKTIIAYFTAQGVASPGTFTVTQEKPGGSGGGSYLIPAWKDTNTVIGSGSYKMVLTSGSRVLAQRYVYPGPKDEVLRINFNRLAEPYLEPREFPIQ